MLKTFYLTMAMTLPSLASATCNISDSIQNKICSTDYFVAKTSKQLNEYLQHGKFKDGKLLNLEVSFDIKAKEINIGISCDLRLKLNTDLKATLNGICLQG